MKVPTSVTIHTTSEGQRISFTYSIVDENTGAVLQDNVRESRVVMDIPGNAEVLAHISGVKTYINNILQQ